MYLKVVISMNLLLEELKKYEKKKITSDILIGIIKTYYPHYKDTSIRWIIYELSKKNVITKISSQLYFIGKLKVYNPLFSNVLSKDIKKLLETKFSDIKFVMYESTCLNEWVNHQVSRAVIFIEVEKYYMMDIFRVIQEKYMNVLFKPNQDTLYRYQGDLIVVSQLFTQAPINRQERTIKLEKLIVDFYTHDLINEFITDDEKEDVIDLMFQTYVINYKTVIAYAKRRKNEDKVISALLNLKINEGGAI